ncbi:zinc-ribbon domain-containing protein [Limosilactobacillus antri]|uniref:Zinc-ribbon domain-containing protein n=1 Tax=Limosilactobacillus antri DSM 16041 TaxID=525309 RepID=C8P6V2_9LACO|nr:zinc ribbon domain-containing protein [Limosilactobacillus antri]EEW53748.1 hypothetical protein HMPREF0494_1046 [Limosilactobacillus antri DSM 16041]KRK59006.1 hypothetical protein FC31_GL000888 [Limosilactobacillus antri DSM 16041]
MNFCQNCGAKLPENAAKCPNCGQPVVSSGPQRGTEDRGSFGWAVLGAAIPLVGLILFLVWRKQTPQNANSAGIGALIGVAFTALFWVTTAITTIIAR